MFKPLMDLARAVGIEPGPPCLQIKKIGQTRSKNVKRSDVPADEKYHILQGAILKCEAALSIVDNIGVTETTAHFCYPAVTRTDHLMTTQEFPMAKAFTTKTVENMKPNPDKRLVVPDPGLTGLYLVVQPSGAKTWAVRYRFDGKPVKLTVGTWPKMELAAARAAASVALGAVEHGNNPAAEKKAEKAAGVAVVDPAFADRDKIKTLIAQFNKRHLSTLRSGAQALDFLTRFVVKAWGERDIKSITKRDVIDLLDGIMDSGKATTANRVKAHLSSFLNWCVGRDIIAISPMSGVKAPGKEVTRDRALSDDEIRLFMLACDAVGEPWGPLGKALLLTGQRLREVSEMTDAEIDGKVWHLPASRTKNGRAHDVPLSEAMQALLKGKERIAGKAGYISSRPRAQGPSRASARRAPPSAKQW